MQRIKLLLCMTVLAGLLVAVIIGGSPYAPVVQVCPENIEDIWAIEDARTESIVPLVTVLENNGIPLAYNAKENTFYCTLGLENEEKWPDVHLHAPGADGVSLVFVDDYQYDFCADAIREGYAYQVMAYTEEEFSYFNIVFTGMMQIQLFTQNEISEEDVPAHVSILDHHSVMTSEARVHYRGAKSITYPKKGMKIEFTRTKDGKKKIERDVPGMGRIQDMILIPMYLDQTLMRDRMCWTMYDSLVSDGESFGPRTTQYVELFVNGEYEGVFVMLEPYHLADEMSKKSMNSPLTDSVYRIRRIAFAGDRPIIEGVFVKSRGFELRYMPQDMEMFSDLDQYIALAEEESDEVFAQKALECIDMDATIRYLIFLQGLGLTDNVFNNLNIWVRHEGAHIIYHYFPWDLDDSLGERSERIGTEFNQWIYFPIADRMLNLNVDGMREKLLQRWTALREGPWSDERFEMWVEKFTRELNDSGASVRNGQRWGNVNVPVDAYELVNFATSRFWMLDQVFAQFAQKEGPIDMLQYTDYDSKSGPIYGLEE